MSILAAARREMEAVNFGPDSEVMLKILDLFFDTWDSGGAVAVASDVLARLIKGQPLSPLTGADDEWGNVSEMSGEPMWQNSRCSTVFRDKTGRCYDIDVPGRPTITFPYDPTTKPVRMPLYDAG